MYLSEIHRILFYLQQHIHEQKEQLDRIEQAVADLKAEWSSGMRLLTEQRAMHIEKIEYNFDQLKVDTLEGTLNIGMTPSSTGDIEQMDVEDTYQHQQEREEKQGGDTT